MSDIVKPSGQIFYKSTYVLGVDLNRRGTDETAFVVVEKIPFANENTGLFISYIETHHTTNLSETIGRIQYLHSLFNFKKIYIDATGLGSGVTDVLKERIPGGVIEEIIFTSKSKPDMFNNLQLLMQRGTLKIPDYTRSNNDNVKKLFYQLLSIQQEFKENSGVPRITHEEGTHDDIVCALALACLYFRVGKVSRSYVIGGFN